MWDSDGFLMPEGAEVVGRRDDMFEMRITIPSDEHGFLGRRCFELHTDIPSRL